MGISVPRRPLFVLSTACLIAALVLSCAGLLPSTEPGTPGGGAFCNNGPMGADQECYPTEAQRADARHAKDYENERPAREARAAAAATEAERQERLRADREQKAAAETAVREESDRQKAKFVAERDRKDAARTAAAAAVHKMALDKEYAGAAISAIMCSIDDEVRGLRADLAREKRVTAVGGVANLKDRNEIASGLVDDADELDGWRKALTRYGAVRVPCREVAGVETCRQNLELCAGKTHDIAQVWAEEIGTLWGPGERRTNR